jgi:hypothetical protein
MFYSDCFEKHGDANGQYNCEPFLNKKKQVVEPNFSFDLCRLGCSFTILYLIKTKDIKVKEMSPFKRIVYEWCMDDTKGTSYTQERQRAPPGFNLYKKIARNKNNSQPIQELKKRIFKQYRCDACDTSEIIVDIDKMPRL